MDKLISFRTCYVPTTGTQARMLLGILIDGIPLSTIELTILLKANPRSALQHLTRKYHWLIHNEGSTQGTYRLDSRHLSGNSNLDDEARVEASLGYLGRSLNLSKRESSRLQNAQSNLVIAQHKANTKQIEINLTPNKK
jgi:hypothetical protein